MPPPYDGVLLCLTQVGTYMVQESGPGCHEECMYSHAEFIPNHHLMDQAASARLGYLVVGFC